MKQWEKHCADPKNKKSRRVALQFAQKAGMRSIGEVRCAADMDAKGIKYAYEHEKLNYTIEATYTPDFTILDSEDMLLEYKGKMTAETRKKIRAIIRCNPERKFALVFERSKNKLSSRPNSLRYWEWANRYDIPWSERLVDPAWFTEDYWIKRRRNHESSSTI